MASANDNYVEWLTNRTSEYSTAVTYLLCKRLHNQLDPLQLSNLSSDIVALGLDYMRDVVMKTN